MNVVLRGPLRYRRSGASPHLKQWARWASSDAVLAWNLRSEILATRRWSCWAVDSCSQQGAAGLCFSCRVVEKKGSTSCSSAARRDFYFILNRHSLVRGDDFFKENDGDLKLPKRLWVFCSALKNHRPLCWSFEFSWKFTKCRNLSSLWVLIFGCY